MAGKSLRAKGVAGSKVGGQKPETVRVKLTIGRETLRRLKLEAFGRGDVPVGQVVDDLVMEKTQRFVLTDRSKGQSGTEGTTGNLLPSGSDRPEFRQDRPTLGLLSETG